MLCEGLELEEGCGEGKDGEVWVRGGKGEESVVEGGRDSEVEMVGVSWV